jgi:DNA-binding HxlR family transcriptional regulator
MAFFRAAGIDRLYSGVTKMNPSNSAILGAPCPCVGVRVHARQRRLRLIEEGEGVVGQVDEFEVGVRARGARSDCVVTIELARDVLARVGDKWTVLVLRALRSGPLRFTAIHHQVAGVSQRMLSQTLRLLTRDGLVTRTAYAEVPPRVEYALTPLGRSLSNTVEGVVEWVRQHQTEVMQSRAEFDQAGK